MPEVVFEPVTLPVWTVPDAYPEVPVEVYRRRFAALEAARDAAGLDALLIYGDREHAANIAWVSGFDPRFEEALWIQGVGARPSLLVGNECVPFAETQAKVPADVRLYQEFSLPAQPRDVNVDLPATLRASGLARGMRCGLVGWKPMARLDVPHWIVEAVQEVTGEAPVNAGGLLMDPATGLRLRVEAEMVPVLEFAASRTSEALKAWMLGLREGMRELESAAALRHAGLELSCHPMTNFGPTIPTGLKSPRNGRVVRGHYAQAALGLVGALTSRAGRLVGRNDPDADGYLELVRNYLLTVRAWYGAVRVGARAGSVVAAAEAARSRAWDFALNPGHLLHTDEWAGSPFVAGSEVPLASGWAIQQDIIPVPADGRAVINMEDGFVLADADLRERLEAEQPAMMRRMRERRAFMERLGYELSEDVLPTSNIPGVFAPFLLEPTVIARFA